MNPTSSIKTLVGACLLALTPLAVAKSWFCPKSIEPNSMHASACAWFESGKEVGAGVADVAKDLLPKGAKNLSGGQQVVVGAAVLVLQKYGITDQSLPKECVAPAMVVLKELFGRRAAPMELVTAAGQAIIAFKGAARLTNANQCRTTRVEYQHYPSQQALDAMIMQCAEDSDLATAVDFANRALKMADEAWGQCGAKAK